MSMQGVAPHLVSFGWLFVEFGTRNRQGNARIASCCPWLVGSQPRLARLGPGLKAVLFQESSDAH